MSDKELGIKVTGDITEISTALDSLAEQIGSFQDRTINMDINVDESALSGLDTAIDNSVSKLDELNDAASSASNTIDSSMQTATDSIGDMSQSSETAQDQLNQIGEEGQNAGDNIATSMDGAVLAVAAVGAAAELSAQQLYDMGYTAEQIGEYTGLGVENAEEMVATLSSASFPRESVESYIVALDQLGVGSDKLEENAEALNEVVLGTKNAASEGTAFARAIKVLGGDVSNLNSYLGMAYYAQDKTVGGLQAFDSIAKAIGPKLKDMGLTAEQSAVVIAAASQKYGGNLRQIRKAINEADGDVGKLSDSLGIQQSDLSNASSTMDNYEGSLHQVAQAGRDAHTPIEETSVSVQDLSASLREILIPAAEVAAVIGGGFGIITIGAKMLDTFGFTQNASKTWAETVKTNLGKVKTSASSITEGWGGWADDAKKSMSRLEKELTRPFKGQFGAGRANTVAGDMVEGLTKSTSQKIADAIPQLSRASELIPEGMGKSISSAASKLLPKFAGEGATIGILFGQGMYNALDNTKKGLGTLLVEMYSFDLLKNIPVVGDIVSQAEWFLNLLGTPEEWMTVLVGKDNVEKMQGWLAGVQEWTRQSWDWIVAWVMNLPTAAGQAAGGMYDSAKSLWDQFTRGFMEAFAPITNLFDNAEQTIRDGLNFLSNIVNEAYNWGKNLIDSWKQGLSDGLSGAKGWLEDKLSEITAPLEGHSPPREGPLMEIDRWGINIGRSFIEGIGEGIGLSTTVLSSALSTLSTGFSPNSFALPQATTSALKTGGSGFPVTINIYLPTVGSREEAVEYGDAAGRSAGQSFAEVLQGQATNAGVSTINMMR